MKKLLISVMITALMAPSAAFAHPPTNVDLSLTDDGRVQVVVTHPVGDPKTHYIYKIEMSLNGKMIEQREYKSQMGNQQIDTFKIPGLKKDDKVEARAYCNKYGDRAGKMVMEEDGTL